MSQGRSVKVRVNALFHRLQINKSIKFQTRILFKRHQSKSQTRLVNHEHGFSQFEQSLFLDLNLVYDEGKGCYQQKNTEIVAIIMYEGKTKSGGYAKYNISQVLNNNLDGKMISIPLTQCPDPNANVEVTFTCESLEEGFGEKSSVLNVSSRDLNMSRVDFHDDKISLQMDRINETINKLGELAKNIKTKQKNTQQKMPQLMKKLQEVEGEKEILNKAVKKLEEQLLNKDKEANDKNKRDQKTISELQKQLQKKDKDFKSREFIEFSQQKKMKEEVAKKQKQIQKYKNLYEQTLNELEQSKSHNLRGSLGFAKMQIDDVHEIAKFESDKEVGDREINKQLTALRIENNELQNNVASMSYKLAKLFNASLEIGGDKLLDYLQNSIGLTEF